jgi:hypothetical protein
VIPRSFRNPFSWERLAPGRRGLTLSAVAGTPTTICHGFRAAMGSALARTEHLFASERPAQSVRAGPGTKTSNTQDSRRWGQSSPTDYLNRRMCTFMSSPIPMKFAISALPPYETSGSGIPVIGMIPSVIPMLTKT